MELSFDSGRFVAHHGRLNYQEVLDDFPNAHLIRIITYNISKNQRMDALLEALKTVSADTKIITNIPSRMDEYYLRQYRTEKMRNKGKCGKIRHG